MTETTPQTVVIIGAGPAGLLLAHYLLRRNYRIELYERLSDPRTVEPSRRRSFPLSLQVRGRKALQGIPSLDEAVVAGGVLCEGTVIHQSSKNRRIPRKPELLTIDRNTLVLVLLERLLADYGDTPQLTLQFDCTARELDLQAQTVGFEGRDGQSFAVRYDRLIGADGVNSAIRETLADRDRLTCERESIRDVYKSIFLTPRASDGEVPLRPNHVHAANLKNRVRLLAAPQPNGSFNGTAIFNPKHNPFEQNRRASYE